MQGLLTTQADAVATPRAGAGLLLKYQGWKHWHIKAAIRPQSLRPLALFYAVGGCESAAKEDGHAHPAACGTQSEERAGTAHTRAQVGKQLAAVGVAIEDHFGKEPQDIEGGLVAGGSGGVQEVVVFQTRPQL